jgi:hypothetical protein
MMYYIIQVNPKGKIFVGFAGRLVRFSPLFIGIEEDNNPSTEASDNR